MSEKRTKKTTRTVGTHEKKAAWFFGTLLLLFFLAVFVFAPATLPPYKIKILAFLSAILGGLFGFFLTGVINIDFVADWKIGRMAVKGAGGMGIFCLVLWWWSSPIAPITEEIPVKPYEQILAGSIRDESGAPMYGVEVSLPEFKKTVPTDNLGCFEFKVKAEHQKTVELMARKDGFVTHEQYATLGNKNLSFTMRKSK